MTDQLALPIVLDEISAPFSSAELNAFLDRWRGVEGVRVLASQSAAYVVPGDAALDVDPRTLLIRRPS